MNSLLALLAPIFDDGGNTPSTGFLGGKASAQSDAIRHIIPTQKK